jgi:hypothetical protein
MEAMTTIRFSGTSPGTAARPGSARSEQSEKALDEADEVSSAELLRQLREEIELLARPAAGQERWLAETRFPVDELALQLYDSFIASFPRLTDRGILSTAASEAVTAVDDLLGTFSGRENAAMWTREALTAEPVWARVRELAQEALDQIDASPGIPGDALPPSHVHPKRQKRAGPRDAAQPADGY